MTHPIKASADEHHILSVHTAVSFKGAAGFFIPRHITKEYMIFITGVPAILHGDTAGISVLPSERGSLQSKTAHTAFGISITVKPCGCS